MGAYMIIHARITDPEGFVEYAKKSPAVVAKYGGRYRSLRGATHQLEGVADDRKTVVVEWPSMEAALAFWNSAEYAELKKMREGAGEMNVRLVEINGP